MSIVCCEERSAADRSLPVSTARDLMNACAPGTHLAIVFAVAEHHCQAARLQDEVKAYAQTRHAIEPHIPKRRFKGCKAQRRSCSRYIRQCVQQAGLSCPVACAASQQLSVHTNMEMAKLTGAAGRTKALADATSATSATMVNCMISDCDRKPQFGNSGSTPQCAR